MISYVFSGLALTTLFTYSLLHYRRQVAALKTVQRAVEMHKHPAPNS